MFHIENGIFKSSLKYIRNFELIERQTYECCLFNSTVILVVDWNKILGIINYIYREITQLRKIQNKQNERLDKYKHK